MGFALFSLILILGFVNVIVSLPDNVRPLMKREELLELAKSDFPKFKSIIESHNPRNIDLGAGDFWSLGNGLLKKKQFDEALWFFTEAYKLKPLTQYLTRQAICHLGKNNFDTAIGLLKEVLLLAPDSVTATSELIKAIFKSGKFDDTVKNALLLLNQENLQYLGQKYANVNKFDEAIHCFNEGLEKISSGNKGLLLARALCYLKMERVGKAISDFTEATKDPNTSLWIYHHFIDAMFLAGRFEEGLREGTQKLDELCLHKLAITFFRGNKFEYTIRICDEALGRDVCPVPFYKWRGYSHVELGDQNAAAEDFRAAYNALQNKTDPEFLDRSPPFERTEILYNLIDTLLSIGKEEDVLQEINKLNETDIKSVADTFHLKNKFENARFVCDHGLTMFPTSADLKKLQGYLERRIIMDSEKREREKKTPADENEFVVPPLPVPKLMSI